MRIVLIISLEDVPGGRLPSSIYEARPNTNREIPNQMSYEEDFKTLLQSLGERVLEDSWVFETKFPGSGDISVWLGLKKREPFIRKLKYNELTLRALSSGVFGVGQWGTENEYKSTIGCWEGNAISYQNEGGEYIEGLGMDRIEKIYLRNFIHITERPTPGEGRSELYDFPIHEATLGYEYKRRYSNKGFCDEFSLVTRLSFSYPGEGDPWEIEGPEAKKAHLDIFDAWQPRGTEEALSACVNDTDHNSDNIVRLSPRELSLYANERLNIKTD